MATKFLLIVLFGALVFTNSNARRLEVEKSGASFMVRKFWHHFPFFGNGRVGFGHVPGGKVGVGAGAGQLGGGSNGNGSGSGGAFGGSNGNGNGNGKAGGGVFRGGSGEGEIGDDGGEGSGKAVFGGSAGGVP